MHSILTHHRWVKFNQTLFNSKIHLHSSCVCRSDRQWVAILIWLWTFGLHSHSVSVWGSCKRSWFFKTNTHGEVLCRNQHFLDVESWVTCSHTHYSQPSLTLFVCWPYFVTLLYFSETQTFSLRHTLPPPWWMCALHVKTCTKWLRVSLVSVEPLWTSLINEPRGRGETPQTPNAQMIERLREGRKGQMGIRIMKITGAMRMGGAGGEKKEGTKRRVDNREEIQRRRGST